MKKYILFLLVGFIAIWNVAVLSAQTPSFAYTANSVTQNMVANSSQNLSYTLSTTLPNVIVICSFNNASAGLSYSFNSNGCSLGGVGVTSTNPVLVNFTLTAASNVPPGSTLTGTLVFQVKPNTGVRVIKYSIPISIQIPSTTSRTITFKNYCPFSVYFGITSSNVPAKNNGTDFPCTSNADCQIGANTYSTCVNGQCGGGLCTSDSNCVNPGQLNSCNTNAAADYCNYCTQDSDCIQGASCDTSNHQCYWTLPAPSDAATNHYRLVPYISGTPATNTVTLPDYSQTNGYALMYGGGFAGRTNCTFNSGTGTLSCETANCNTNGNGDGNGGCELAEGFDAPSTVAEFTFVGVTPDTYDTTVINGVTVPTAFYPTFGSAASPIDYANPYTCGNAGNINEVTTSNGSLGGCSWSYTPPSSNVAYRWVRANTSSPAGNCASDATCETNYPGEDYACGLTSTAVGTTAGGTSGSAQTTCGKPLGYWNQNEICATNVNYDTAFLDCTAGSGGTFGGNTIINLLACTGAGGGTSCYNVSSASTTCCGCTNWQDQGITIPSNPSIVQQCTYPNAYWVNGNGSFAGILHYLTWLKTACPSSYVFPYDDKSSTFGCPANNGQSAVNYTVEFCPGQETAGLPPGT